MSWTEQTRERVRSGGRGGILAIVLLTAIVALVIYSFAFNPRTGDPDLPVNDKPTTAP